MISSIKKGAGVGFSSATGEEKGKGAPGGWGFSPGPQPPKEALIINTERRALALCPGFGDLSLLIPFGLLEKQKGGLVPLLSLTTCHLLSSYFQK